MIEFEQDAYSKYATIATIKVVGVGGAGGNTVNSIIQSGCEGIEFIAVNTDSQALDMSKASKKIQIGVKSTKGLGTGTNPEIGQRAAEEDLDKVLEAIGDADIVFLAAGMGGGTGSGALPVIANALREKGILSIAIVTKPFAFEGKRRMRVADDALDHVREQVDTLLVVQNQRLLDIVDHKVSMIDAFSMINDLLTQSVRGISDIITRPGHINVDFADVRTIMKDRGLAVMGTGKAAGEDRAELAAMEAISSPLLENMSVEGARGVLFNITGGKTLGLHEIGKAASIIYEQAHEDANIIIGSVIDESLGDDVIVTIIATGFEEQDEQEIINTPETNNDIKIQPTTIAQVEKVVQAAVHEAVESEVAQKVALVKEELIEEAQLEKEIKAEQEALQAQEVLDKEMAALAEPSIIENADCQKGACVEDAQEAPVVVAKHSQAHDVDVDDLDVPAFMRHKQEQK